MQISENSQLGLRFISDKQTKVVVLELIEAHHKGRIEDIQSTITELETLSEKVETQQEAENFIIPAHLTSENIESVDFGTIDRMFCFGPENNQYIKAIKYFLIQPSVWKAAELIKIGENFTGRTLKDIKQGDYVYLLGKHQMLKFLVVPQGIKGIYFDDKEKIFFEWGIKMETGEAFHYTGFNKEFSKIMQLLTFVELGDIEVSVLESLKNNGAKTRANKIYNGSRNTVFVVDSSWNKLVIRTDGFAVRGHFRLQPCGPANADRKLIWVDAFEKHGYTRRPKAEIIK